MAKGLVVFLFCLNESNAQPWLEAGYEVMLVDIQHAPGAEWQNGVLKVHADLRHGFVLPPEYMARLVFIGCFPPCDHLAVSGARWFKGKGLRKLAWSVDMFATAAEFCESAQEYGTVPYFIENPVSTISTYWRKADYTFSPEDYTGWWVDDNYTKRTCVWTGGSFVMPLPFRLEGLPPPDDRIHKCPPSAERHNIRSATPMGFTLAAFESNRPLV